MRFVGSCWQIAPSGSGHNEPIRLYFYFRHAAYRAIPSRRGGYRDAAVVHTRMIRTRARVGTGTRTGAYAPRSLRGTRRACTPASGRDEVRHGKRLGTPRRSSQGPILRCPRGPLTLMLTPTLPPLPFGLYRERVVRTCVCTYHHKVGSESRTSTRPLLNTPLRGPS